MSRHPERGQTGQSRQHRLAKGQCPVHGTLLTQTGLVLFGGEARPVIGCPRASCDFESVPYAGSELWRALDMGDAEFELFEYDLDEAPDHGWDAGNDDGVSRESEGR